LGTDALTVQLPTTNIAGGFHVYAKISNGTTTRYYYAPARAIVTAPGFSKTWIGPATGGDWSAPANWSTTGVPAAGDYVAVYDSAVSLNASAAVAGLALYNNATLSLATGGDKVLSVNVMSIPAGTYIDLYDNDMIYNYSGSPSPADYFDLLIALG